ncbi:MAG: stress-responsive transcription factor hsf1 [Pycnora praestabilis]|nr:MAG: stress-responsive transcription factor hsf1 [Pycnora praestabilis]
MPPQMTSRKRPAPGTSPVPQHTPQQTPTLQLPPNANSPQLSAEQFLRWGQDPATNPAAAYPSPSSNYHPNAYSGMGGGPGGGPQNTVAQPAAAPSSPSNQLARRSTNHQLVARGRVFNSNNNVSWTDAGDMAQQQGNGWTYNDDELEQRALIAKREAATKRKQIPPFVQKLSSFLEDPKNFDLIRWSSNGDSFVVIDEDEFAKRLIPELFKHNNYASFVRQLNMYGFHKKVGLSDNSMNASADGKRKSPSEYSHPYFRRGKPDLLWLINKPKPSKDGANKGKGQRIKNDPDEFDNEDDEMEAEVDHPRLVTPGRAIGPNPDIGDDQVASPGGTGPPNGSISTVRQEIQAIQNQQRIISSTINRLRAEHQQLFEQAGAFQSMHDRHESSINAILTFLATVYNRSLEGHGGQNFSNMFANAIPHDPQGHGNVVDVGDYADPTMNTQNNQLQRPFQKKQPLLLKAPPSAGQDGYSSRSTTHSPAASSSSPRQQHQGPAFQQNRPAQQYSHRDQLDIPRQSGAIEELSDSRMPYGTSRSPRVISLANTPDGQVPESDIMSLINSANANTDDPASARFDFPAALSHFENANGNSPLTPKQRNDVLNMIANNTNAGNGMNNALTSPNPPPMPNLQQLGNTREELDNLLKMQAEQDSKLQNLSRTVQPLSPTGSIPGLANDQYYGGQGDQDDEPGPGPLDLDQIFNSGDYFTGQGNNDLDFDVSNHDLADGVNFDFDTTANGMSSSNGYEHLDDQQQQAMTGNGRVVESLNSSEATSPANTVEESVLDDGRSPKRRRKK